MDLEKIIPPLEFIARSYPPAWQMLAKLVDEADADSSVSRATEYLRRYLQTQPADEAATEAWQRLVDLYKKSNDPVGASGAFISAAKISEAEIDEISNMANYLNHASEVIGSMDVTERSALFMPLATLLEARLGEASATDLSRLSWLYLHCGNETRAMEMAELGLDRDPTNIHCSRIVAKLTDDAQWGRSGRSR